MFDKGPAFLKEIKEQVCIDPDDPGRTEYYNILED